jgi:hypothetical protein
MVAKRHYQDYTIEELKALEPTVRQVASDWSGEIQGLLQLQFGNAPTDLEEQDTLIQFALRAFSMGFLAGINHEDNDDPSL